MKYLISLPVVALVFCGLAMGETDRRAMKTVDELRDGTQAIATVDIDGGTVDGAVVGGTTAAAGTFTTLSGTTIGGITEANLVDKTAAESITGTYDFAKVTLDVSSQTVTNGEAITGGKSYVLLTGTAGGTTNTIANQVEGQILVIINTSANSIVLADSGNLALSGNAVLGQNDSLTLFWTAAGTGVEIAQTDN